MSTITINLEGYVKTKLGWQNDSVDEGALPSSHKAWWPKFNPWDPHGGSMVESSIQVVLWPSFVQVAYLCKHIHTNKQTNKRCYKYEMGFSDLKPSG